MDTTVGAAEKSGQERDTSPIVVGVDDRGRSTSAVVWAAEEADQTGALVRLVSVQADQTRAEDPTAAHGLAALARRLTLADVEYRTRVGDVQDALLEAAEGAAVLVVGRRGRRAAQSLMVGSTSMAVAGRSAAPVVVVPETWIQPNLSSAPIVVGVSSSLDLTHTRSADTGRGHQVLVYAFARAARLRVPLIVVSAWQVPALYARSPDDIAGCLRQFTEALDRRLKPWKVLYPQVEVVARSVAEPPDQALLQAGLVAQLLVVGRHPGSHTGGLSRSSTTRSVLHRATRPVAVVPDAPFRDGPHDEIPRAQAADSPTWAPMF